MIGTVYSWKVRLGYGFAKNDSGQVYFVHNSEILDSMEYRQLFPGQQITFDPIVTTKGSEARNVKIFNKPISANGQLATAAHMGGT